MRAGRPQVPQQLPAVAPGVLQRVGQDGQVGRVQGAVGYAAGVTTLGAVGVHDWRAADDPGRGAAVGLGLVHWDQFLAGPLALFALPPRPLVIGGVGDSQDGGGEPAFVE